MNLRKKIKEMYVESLVEKIRFQMLFENVSGI